MGYEGPHPFPVHIGGTGDSSFTAFSVLCGGVTSTAALQNVSGVGAATEVLTSNGAGMLPTWQPASGGTGFSSINIQAFSASGTYTPTANMAFCIVQAAGGGGAGGGNNATVAGGGGGGAGGYSLAFYPAATIGVSQVVTIGAAGTGVVSGAGNSGGTTTFGALITCNGGVGGSAGNANFNSGAAGGTASGGIINITGGHGSFGFIIGSLAESGFGASSQFGSGGPAQGGVAFGSFTGSTIALAYGAGGGGVIAGSMPLAGGNGGSGLVIITEFIS